MKAVIISAFGDPSVLTLQERPIPSLKANEILIEVKAAGVNRPDIAQRKGFYPAPLDAPQDIPGLEVAGIVVSKGDNATRWQIGDRVCALVSGGGYAEYVNVHEGQCLPVPPHVSFAEAASLPETVFTVWHNIFQRGSLIAGESLLVHGGSSGIGVTAIQLAKAMGAKVFTTVGSDLKGETCLKLGADRYINYKVQDFEQVLSTEGVDVILDMVGGDYFDKNLNILKPEGRLVYINAMSGNNVNLNIMKMMLKRITITGSTLRSRDTAFKTALTADVYKNVWHLLSSERFKPTIYATFPISEASKAHALMESSNHIGKIVLTTDS